MSENVLRDTRNGESLHVRDEPRWMLFAVIDDHPIRLTYYNNKLQKGDLGIAEFQVIQTGENRDINIKAGYQTLGLAVRGSSGIITAENPVQTDFLFEGNDFISCKYSGDTWYWTYSEGEVVVVRKTSSTSLPTKFMFARV